MRRPEIQNNDFSKLKPQLHGFILDHVDDLEEFHARGALYIHKKTGAQVYHLEAPDKENLASFGFPTPVEDSTGVAHILEHSVLCGSRNYPTKDPFLYLLKSSVNTFLNAMTYPDKTLYPVASTIPKDFYNLFRVYADAVFFPLLKPEVFTQEGHRIEWDENGGLVYSGVVYNEMKGNYSSSDSVISDAVLRGVFDQGPYLYDSGGDPAVITSLTYENFLRFHHERYNPSNCFIFLYGNQKVVEALKILDKEYFSFFGPNSKVPAIRNQTHWQTPKELKASYPAGPEESKDGTVSLSWLVCETVDHQKLLELDILSEILLGEAGLLQKALLDSGLGEDLSPVTGLETDLRDSVFAVGLRGCAEGNAHAFQNLVFSELASYVEKGIPSDLVDAVLCAYEFSGKEVKGSGMGLRFMRRLYRSWLYGANPKEALLFNQRLQNVKERLAQGEKVFEKLIQNMFIENNHRTLTICLPDLKLLEKTEESLKEHLSRVRISMSSQELQKLKDSQEALKQFHNQEDRPQDVKRLPFLKLSDIPGKVDSPEAVWESLSGVNLATHHGETNGITNLDWGFNLENLTPRQWALIPLFQRCWDSLGLKNLSYELLARKITELTGGLVLKSTADSSLLDRKTQTWLWLRLKVLDEKIDPAFDLLEKMLFDTLWDNTSRLKDLILEMRNDFQSSLVPRGHVFAAYRSAASFSLASTLADLTGGLGQMDFLNDLTKDLEQQLPIIKMELAELACVIWNPLNSQACVTGSSSGMNKAKKRINNLAVLLAQQVYNQATSRMVNLSSFQKLKNFEPVSPFILRTIPSTVGFSSLTLPGSLLNEPSHPAELVLSHAMKTGYLWEVIRMKGGAYGAFSTAGGLEGTFSFATYRDPRLNASITAFHHALEFYATHPLLKKEMEDTIIGTLGSDLIPRSPSEDGFYVVQRKLLGVTHELRQEKRDTLLNLKVKDLQKASEGLLSRWSHSQVFALASEAQATDAEKEGLYPFKKEN